MNAAAPAAKPPKAKAKAKGSPAVLCVPRRNAPAMMAVPHNVANQDVEFAVDDPDDDIYKIGRKGSGLKCYTDVEQIDIPLAYGVTVGATKYYRNSSRDRSPRNYRHAHSYQRYWDSEEIPDWVEAMRQDSEWKARHEAWNLALSFGFDIDFLNVNTESGGEGRRRR